MRAHDHEWPVIKRFIDCSRFDISLCEDAVRELEMTVEAKKRELAEKAEAFRGPTMAEKTAMAKELRQQGKSQQEIASFLGLTQARVSQLLAD